VGSRAQLAVGDRGSSSIRIFNPEVGVEPVETLTFHRSPVLCITFSNALNVAISGDEDGVLEYWRGGDFKFPADIVKFKHKVRVAAIAGSTCACHLARAPVFSLLLLLLLSPPPPPLVLLLTL
jgi:WD40 repeat protein